jgi:hypothetical protein
VNNELRWKWKELAVALFHVLCRKLSRGIEENQAKPQAGDSVFQTEILTRNFWNVRQDINVKKLVLPSADMSR